MDKPIKDRMTTDVSRRNFLIGGSSAVVTLALSKDANALFKELAPHFALPYNRRPILIMSETIHIPSLSKFDSKLRDLVPVARELESVVKDISQRCVALPRESCIRPVQLTMSSRGGDDQVVAGDRDVFMSRYFGGMTNSAISYNSASPLSAQQFLQTIDRTDLHKIPLWDQTARGFAGAGNRSFFVPMAQMQNIFGFGFCGIDLSSRGQRTYLNHGDQRIHNVSYRTAQIGPAIKFVAEFLWTAFSSLITSAASALGSKIGEEIAKKIEQPILWMTTPSHHKALYTPIFFEMAKDRTGSDVVDRETASLSSPTNISKGTSVQLGGIDVFFRLFDTPSGRRAGYSTSTFKIDSSALVSVPDDSRDPGPYNLLAMESPNGGLDARLTMQVA